MIVGLPYLDTYTDVWGICRGIFE